MAADKKIVVAGDVTIDWLHWRFEAKDPKGDNGGEWPNWELFPGTEMVPLEGGALLLAKLIRTATGLPVLAPSLDNLTNIPPKEVLHSNVRVAKFPHTQEESQRKEDEPHQVFRVEEYLGYCGPGADLDRLRVKEDPQDADLVILDDAGNNFRHTEDIWPQAIGKGKRPLVILKMSRPLQQGHLWEHLRENHADRLVVVISADALRAEEINISRQLSWERTALDFIWHLAHNDKLQGLKDCAHLIVRCGLDGAIRYHHAAGRKRAWLYYDPNRMEGGFQEEIGRGGMMGLEAAFVAGFTGQIVQHSLQKNLSMQDSLEEVVGLGVREAIMSSRRLLELGYGQALPGSQDPRLWKPAYPEREIFAPVSEQKPEITEFNLSFPSVGAPWWKEMENWSILAQSTANQQEYVASAYLENGSNLNLMPMGRFGKLITVDRKEIESLNSIKNLIKEYRQQDDRQQRPLSIAVFGPPGAGKSFTVTQVAQSVIPESLKPLEFNLSQCETPKDLVMALHQVRDVSLKGKLPLVFFDEFDCRFRDVPLGWLKYFLAPMQDGAFREGDITFHLSKAIFVFAGGTCSTMERFSREALFAKEEAGEELSTEERKVIREFRIAKGPDFISRLRGYVNIPGINPDRHQESDDGFSFIRRALLLRNLLQSKASQIFDREKKKSLRIDWGVLQGLIKVPRYKHGVRSLQAVLEMSRLSNHRKFEAAALPPQEQLRLHVEELAFGEMVRNGVRQAIQVEEIAPLIHENYRKDQKGKKPPGHPSIQPWEKLREDLKESNRGQARHIEVKLKAIDCGYRRAQQPRLMEFSQENIELMARMEHERWMLEKRNDGYVYGPKRDDDKKIHDCLLNWEELSEEVKGWDFSTVEAIPEIFLAPLGFEVYLLK